MGATCLVYWKDANGQQSLTLLSDRLLRQFHASPIGRWTINWKVFRDTSPVSKSGTGKMMHVVHVQGGATTRGVPLGSQAANSSAGGSGTAGGGAAGAGGMGAESGGIGSGGAGINANVAHGTAGKTGLGILPSGVGSGAGAGVGSGGVTGSGSGQLAVDTPNSTAWCIIDDGGIGAQPLSATTAAPSTESPKRKAVLVEVEKDVEALIAKLKNLWVHRQHAQVEGHVFDLGDFIVRAGNIMVASTTYKGILLEIEYLPQTSSATASNAILEEFVRLISPPNVNLYSPQMLDYPYEQVGLDPKRWSMLHSGFQFITLFRRHHIL
ncbi:hypothetical protein BGZ99_001321 [Dissophora globulifera]|uniref:Mediator of RNA polymerase II transcription subunit 20 n=1 Tax=Dissophora globulifera TaxID=979702 RepID=A0A9P6RP19_9FUNG|nr:hypothetical protein BGZ99_001321 [Dissophora globulifera]